jgi:hypothetical protein
MSHKIWARYMPTQCICLLTVSPLCSGEVYRWCDAYRRHGGNISDLPTVVVLIWRSSPIILSLSVTVLMTVTLSVTGLLIVSRFKSQVLTRQERQPGILVFPLTFQTCHCHSNQSLRVSPSHTNQIAILNRLIILISSSISIIRVLAFVELINRTNKKVNSLTLSPYNTFNDHLVTLPVACHEKLPI